MLLLLSAALALDTPSLWAREAVAVAGWPTGALSNTLAELRVPLWRSDSIVFQDTRLGMGAQVLATPAFASVGPRLSFAPIDIFEVNGKIARYWGFGNSFGNLPFDHVGDKLGRQRDARGDEAFPTSGWIYTLEPTLKLKVGPIVAFDAWTIDHFQFPDAPGAPYFYEPYRDLVIAPDDWSIEQQAAVLYQAEPGEALLRMGATVRDTFTLVSKDHRTNLGPIVVFDPGGSEAVPTVVGMALWYLRDADRVGPIPYMAAQVRWEVERPL